MKVGNKSTERWGVEKKKETTAPHNNPIMRLINDVMKANSVKIACKQLDLSLLMNSVSLLSKWGYAREGEDGRRREAGVGGRVSGRVGRSTSSSPQPMEACHRGLTWTTRS